MLSLILDSANKELGVAIAKDNEIIDEIKYDAWQKQSELMIPEIEKIFKRNSISPKDINEILVSQGPGSYTGVRIALTIAKVYAYALNLPIYAFSSNSPVKFPFFTSIIPPNGAFVSSVIFNISNAFVLNTPACPDLWLITTGFVSITLSISFFVICLFSSNMF